MSSPGEEHSTRSHLPHDSSSTQEQPSGELHQRCCYAGKHCENPRVSKRNGALHRLCAYHRTRANQNQRRLEAKRKLNSTQQPELFIRMDEWSEFYKETGFQYIPPAQAPAYEFDEEDFHVLQALLFDEDEIRCESTPIEYIWN